MHAKIKNKIFVDRVQAENMLRLKPGTIKRWRSRYFDLPSAIDDDGEVTYALHDVAALIIAVEDAAGIDRNAS